MSRARPLYLVVRADLAPVHQAIQAAHAVVRFFVREPAAALDWATTSEVIALLSVPDEAALAALADRAVERGAAHAPFREPDLGDSLTALALGPGRPARRLTARLPLAFAA